MPDHDLTLKSQLKPKPVATRRYLFGRRQPIAKTVRHLALQFWVRSMGRLSAVSPVFTRLAILPLGPYKDRKQIFRYWGERPYVSPLAQVNNVTLNLGPKSFIDDYVTIYAHPGAVGQVSLARNVHIYRWAVIELGEAGSLNIGENTYLQSGCLLNPYLGSITIGAHCMIAPRCSFMPYRHDFSDLSRPMREQPIISKGGIVIEDNVWLGLNVSVMDGVTIGEGAVVGAGAVVTKDIPPFAIAGGIPARVLRSRKPEEITPANHVQSGLNSEEAV